MNIQMTEVRTGLTRANIRYYEKEGLLAPQRQANGYRDYSEGDIQALLRIKLLRELGISIEEIRKAQRNEITLSWLLDQRIAAIREETANLQATWSVCDEMRRSGVTYGNLDAEHYLQFLQQQRQGIAFRPADLSEDREPYAPHPWRRYFARGLDFSLSILLLAFLWYTVLDQFFTGRETFLLTWLLPVGVTLLLEPLLLYRFGTTPGKWIMGIRVLDPDGGKLSLSAAFSRTISCLWWSQGMGIPIYSLYRLYKSYSADMAGAELPWEEDSELFFQDTRSIRGVALTAAYVISILLTILVAMESLLPPNRGPLTPAELAENYSWYAKVFGLTENWILEEDGQWTRRADDTDSITITVFSSDKDIPPAPFVYTLTDGIIQEISYTTDLSYDPETDPDHIPGDTVLFPTYTTQLYLMSFAVIGAQQPWDLLGLNAMAAERFWEPFFHGASGTVSQSRTIGNVEFSCTQDSEGYLLADTFMIPENEGLSTFHRELTIVINN